MDIRSSSNPPSSDQLGKVTDRLNLYKNHLTSSSSPSSTISSPKVPSNTPTMAARDPITCHVLNTLTGTPAANLPVTLTLLSSANTTTTTTFTATTNADGRVANWTPTPESAAASGSSVTAILASLPAANAKTNWALRFEVGPWFEAQGVESFWPEVEVKFTVNGRGKEGEEGWRHYHVPVLLGPWNYSTYRGS